MQTGLSQLLLLLSLLASNRPARNDRAFSVMSRLFFLISIACASSPAQSSDWILINPGSGVENWARVNAVKGSNVYVKTKLKFQGKDMWPSSWTINCTNKVMVNEVGMEWVERLGVWRSADENKSAPPSIEDLFHFACG